MSLTRLQHRCSMCGLWMFAGSLDAAYPRAWCCHPSCHSGTDSAEICSNWLSRPAKHLYIKSKLCKPPATALCQAIFDRSVLYLFASIPVWNWQNRVKLASHIHDAPYLSCVLLKAAQGICLWRCLHIPHFERTISTSRDQDVLVLLSNTKPLTGVLISCLPSCESFIPESDWNSLLQENGIESMRWARPCCCTSDQAQS